ncbi:cation:proton antiporter [Candidatus Roizmanbacteria bacterium]|nr:cation:proton antiporter [Candidatus Roizmanbacteria bacterium]
MNIHSEALFLVQALILIGLPYFIWKIKFIRAYMPLVVIQIIIGVLLGPTILAKIFPQAYQILFPSESLSIVNGLSWFAVVFFGFLTGLHFDSHDIKDNGKSFSIISLASIFAPLTLGAGVGWFLYERFPELVGSAANHTTFAFGLGILAAVTALPVLSSILLEMNLIHTNLGRTVLGFATVSDGSLWILISVLLALVRFNTFDVVVIFKIAAASAIYLLFMFLVAKPFIVRLIDNKTLSDDPDHGELVVITCLLLASAITTELIGIHYLLGAFLFGAIIPKKIAIPIYEKTESIVLVILLPFFFILTGLKTHLVFEDVAVWAIFGFMTITTVVGKFFGTAVPAKICGYSTRTSLLFGSFMLCKGLMEIVVLNIILQAQIISSVAFSGMVLMALVSTIITKPLGIFFEEFKRQEHPNIAKGYDNVKKIFRAV